MKPTGIMLRIADPVGALCNLVKTRENRFGNPNEPVALWWAGWALLIYLITSRRRDYRASELPSMSHENAKLVINLKDA